MISVCALYKFCKFDDYREWQEPLRAYCDESGIMGTILLATEGINGTVAGDRPALDGLLAMLAADGRMDGLSVKWSEHPHMPFYRMKVRLKKEIVTLGVEGVSPLKCVGEYVEPENWNDLIRDPEVLLIDTRNDYEVEVGKFAGALDPHTRSFREFPDYVAQQLDPEKHQKVAMYCTGGIRCEKATALLLERGFKEVYHLKGGILSYLAQVDPEDSLWEGDCFVFDQRVAVDHSLSKGDYEMCGQCRQPITPEDFQSPKFEAGVSCPKCADSLTPKQIASARERHHQIQLAKQRNTVHLGSRAQVRAKPTR